MSRVDDLIAEMAPQGVRFVSLGEVARIASARAETTSLTAENYVGVDNLLPNFGGRKDSGYKANSSGAIKFHPGDLLIGNIRPYLRKVWLADREGGASPDVLTISVRPDWLDRVMARFLYFVIASEAFISYSMQHAKGAKMPRGDKAATLAYRIPVPPLEVQREIVRILDHFTALEAELEAELEARRLQFAHYRSLVVAQLESSATRVTLGQIGRIVTGRTPHSSDPGAWGDQVDFVTPSDIKNGMRAIRSTARRLSPSGAASMATVRIPAGSLLVTCIGADMGKTVLNTNDCVPNQQINAIIPTGGVEPGFLFHVLSSMRDDLRRQGERGGGTLPLINKSDFSKIEVPLPSLLEQRRAARILDDFHALVNDLGFGLPAELRARRQQYEYYRDKLLSFPEAL